MSKAIIEIVQGDDGKLKYAVTKSGSQDVDKLLDVALGTMNLYAKTGGNMQNLMGTLGPQAQQGLGAMLSNLGGNIGNSLGSIFGGNR